MNTVLECLSDLGFPVIKTGMTTMVSWSNFSLKGIVLIRSWEIFEMPG